ncbi:MAG TPA: acetate--CoA ligase family protein, partial [Thermodesulfobacteriota bacterium]|nr:acetate--CoA ligase family protein [Thermodesulfobacteriota bacterium]
VGPNGFTIANRASGLCLPFVPIYPPLLGDISIVSQSGGLGITIWNQLMDENLGMAKFASVGNKLDLDEVDFLEYFGTDAETRIVLMYLENVKRGRELVEVASRVKKPVVVLKANTTPAGNSAAMSHTAALSNDDEVIDTAFEKAGIIRVRHLNDLITIAKAFKLPPLKGNRVMVMSPAGGFAVSTADLCVEEDFTFADPGPAFYQGLQQYSKAGVIRFSNPLDMGDIYDPTFSAHIFSSVMHNEAVDGAFYVSHIPHMPTEDDIFSRMLRSDLSKETWGAILSSGKPVGICFYGLAETINRMKQRVNFPVFTSPETMIHALARQREYHARLAAGVRTAARPGDIKRSDAEEWITAHQGTRGDEVFQLLSLYGVSVVQSHPALNENEAADCADLIGYPVALKVLSPDALHKSEVNGVVLNIPDRDTVRTAFHSVKKNLLASRPNALFQGATVQKMVHDGYDMFIGGKYDDSFGPVVYFGLGGVYVEVFKDVNRVLCPASSEEIEAKLKKLKSFALLAGSRGQAPGDIQHYAEVITRVSWLLADFPQIQELDINPLRVLPRGEGVIALDARIRIR